MERKSSYGGSIKSAHRRLSQLSASKSTPFVRQRSISTSNLLKIPTSPRLPWVKPQSEKSSPSEAKLFTFHDFSKVDPEIDMLETEWCTKRRSLCSPGAISIRSQDYNYKSSAEVKSELEEEIENIEIVMENLRRSGLSDDEDEEESESTKERLAKSIEQISKAESIDYLKFYGRRFSDQPMTASAQTSLPVLGTGTLMGSNIVKSTEDVDAICRVMTPIRF